MSGSGVRGVDNAPDARTQTSSLRLEEHDGLRRCQDDVRTGGRRSFPRRQQCPADNDGAHLNSAHSGAARTRPSAPTPARSPRSRRRGRPPNRRMRREDKRLALALLLSLLIHILLLGLTSGGQGVGLPGIGLPWRDRRIEAPDLHIVLVPGDDMAAGPAITPGGQAFQREAIKRPAAPAGAPPAQRPSMPAAPSVAERAAALALASKTTAQPWPARNAAVAADPAPAHSRVDVPGETAPPQTSEPAAVDVKAGGEVASIARAAAAASTAVIAAAPSASSPQTVMPADRVASDIPQERSDPAKRARRRGAAEPDPAERERRLMSAATQEAAAEEAERLAGGSPSGSSARRDRAPGGRTPGNGACRRREARG